MTIFYTYYSYEEFGRGYIGYRKCPENYTPETDPYLGSYTDKTFTPTQKIILGIYNNHADAIADEIILHRAYDVASNPHFANRARMTSVGFSVAGTTHSAEARAKMSENSASRRPEVRAKISEALRGKPLSAETRAKISKNNGNRGKPLSAETRAKISAAKSGKPISAETRQKMSKNNAMKRPEVAAKVAEAHRKKAKRYAWENIQTGEKHENLCIAELRDFHPDLSYHGLRKVAIGNRKRYRGWIVVVCYL